MPAERTSSLNMVIRAVAAIECFVGCLAAVLGDYGLASVAMSFAVVSLWISTWDEEEDSDAS